jgi:hypothetical protein
MMQPEGELLIGSDCEAADRRASGYLQIDRCGQEGDVGSADTDDATVGVAQQRPDEPVLSAGGVFQFQLHPAC